MTDVTDGALDALANASLALWLLPPDAKARRINVSENVTYLVEGAGQKAVLRLHRPAYHSRRAIECELAWANALREAGAVRTPQARAGRDGVTVQIAQAPGSSRFAVLFDFVDGNAPDESQDLTGGFTQLGVIAARMHRHSRTWSRPASFERLRWDADAVFGPDATWGDWRDAPNVTSQVSSILEPVQALICQRLATFGQGPDRFGLIHADMRLANLLIDPSGTVVIDFDDCGFGWFLYDFAAAISFIEDHPQVPALREAWIDGYRQVQPLPDVQEAEIDTFVMLRRMALLAWIGSHIEAPEPQALAPHFADGTAALGQAYLDRMG